MLEFFSSDSGEVTFNASTGMLRLDNAASFSGPIAGISGSGDVVNLQGYDSGTTATPGSYNSATNTTILTVNDAGHAPLSLSLLGNFSQSTFTVTTDVKNGGIDIADPPATVSSLEPSVSSVANADGLSGSIAFSDIGNGDTFNASFAARGTSDAGSFSLGPVNESNGTVSVDWAFKLAGQANSPASGETLTESYDVTISDAQNPVSSVNQTVSVTIGGPGNDNFVFQPGIGADTISNFNPQQDTIELDHFTNAQTIQEVQSLITTSAHGDAVISLGHNDSVTVAGETPTQLQQLIQMGHVLLH
jgi:hypothetical protein